MSAVEACVRLGTTTPEETRQVAVTVARALRPGDVVSLTGELGAGKTSFVRGAAGELGVIERVTSPSFLLRREYTGRVPVLHLDVYRLETLQEVVDLGWEDALGEDFVTFVEWGDAMEPLLPSEHLEVELVTVDHDGPLGDPDRRRIVVSARGEGWRGRFEALSADLAAWRE